jgi:quercetin dioxygenase-like cupin family protein
MFAALLSALALLAAGPVTVPKLVLNTTASGQPILLPQGPVAVSTYLTTLASGAVIPAHRHPWPRYAYIVSGKLKVTNLQTGTVQILGAGDFAVEARDQWHMGETLDGTEVQLYVIDQAPPGEANMIRREP